MTEKAISDKKYVDFDVIAENWSIYELEDKSILRTRTVLLSIEKVDEGIETKKAKSNVKVQLMTVIDSGKNKGSPGKKWDVTELEKYITEPNMMFRQIKDGGPSNYETEKSSIFLRPIIKQVSKTSEFDLNGDPAYIVKSESEILVCKKSAIKIETENVSANSNKE